MTITTFSVGVAVTPTVVKTCVSHYTSRKSRHQKPTAHISYDEGLHLIRCFLNYASHKTVEELQSFTANIVPHPPWVRTENVSIPTNFLTTAADIIIDNLGEDGIKQVGGRKWWQWRQNASPLKAEWIEMRSDYSKRRYTNTKPDRVMLYVHGGGYFFGSVDEHRYQMQRHARKLNARVIAPRYRLAPQFPFPCGLQDCLAVYLYLLTVQSSTEIILAGDSAGGGMVLTIMCLLRDQNLPLPAGAVLISPWVDLTHSFPSMWREDSMDYIPPQGFHYKPSIAWPPLDEDELAALKRSQSTPPLSDEAVLEQGITQVPHADAVPRQSHQLSVEVDGVIVKVKDQIQMYTTNQLMSHPLVSPVLQPSLGGLAPILVVTGGGELLRDEQIYLAHKAANPHKYPLGPQYRARYDPGDKILNKYKPTPVQLQVWDDLCHATPTLSFTRPAKYMYRSIAQFGAWALARAQNRPIEIVDDDNISVISSNTSSSSRDGYGERVAKQQEPTIQDPKTVGKAGDPLPIFKNHMIRQRVDRYGNIFPLPPAEELAATSMDPSEVGVVKEGPARKWLAVKRQYDARYAGTKSKVRKLLLQRLAQASKSGLGDGENPPPSALAGRRIVEDEVHPKAKKSYGLAMWSGWGSKHDENTIKREEEFTGYNNNLHVEANDTTASKVDDGLQGGTELPVRTGTRESMRQTSKSLGVRNSASRSRSRSAATGRMRTISVTDKGQADGNLRDPHDAPGLSVANFNQGQGQSPHPELVTTNPPPSTSYASELGSAVLLDPNQHSQNPIFLPKYKTVHHLRGESKAIDSDAASTATDVSMISASDQASTTAVFSAPGVSKKATTSTAAATTTTKTTITHRQFTQDGSKHTLSGNPASGNTNIPTFTTNTATGDVLHGSDTPASRRSLERLQTNNHLSVSGSYMSEFANLQAPPTGTVSARTSTTSVDGGELNAPKRPPIDHLRNPSTMALVQVEGVTSVVVSDGEEEKDQEKDGVKATHAP